MKATAAVKLFQDGNRVYLSSKEVDIYFETNTLDDKTREFCVFYKGEEWMSCSYENAELRNELFGKAIQRFIKETL